MILKNLYETEDLSYGEFLVKKHDHESTCAEVKFTTHYHLLCEIILVCSGKLDLICGNDSFSTYKDDIIYIEPNMLHYGMSGQEGCLYRVIQFYWSDMFSSTPAEKRLAKMFEDCLYTFENKFNDPKAVELFNKIYQVNDSDDLIFMVDEKSALYNFLSYLIKKHLLVNTKKSYANDRFNDILEYVNKNFTLSLTTDEVAAKFAYNTQFFCRLFKSRTNFTFKNYVNLCRIEKAQLLIQEQKHDLSTIATMCGFNNTSYFSTVFKEYLNQTPSQYQSQFTKSKHK